MRPLHAVFIDEDIKDVYVTSSFGRGHMTLMSFCDRSQGRLAASMDQKRHTNKISVQIELRASRVRRSSCSDVVPEEQLIFITLAPN